MSTTIVDVIHDFFDREEAVYKDQRESPRERFYRPAKVITSDGVEHDAFTRDISRNGVGLMHDEKLVPGRVRIEIDLRTGVTAEVDADLLWCCQLGSHYISGAQFIEEFPR